MAGVWILAEESRQVAELLSIGRALADGLGTRLSALVPQDRGEAGEYIACGADEVLLLPPLAQDESLEVYAPVIASEARKAQPTVFLVAGTSRGRDLAARVAARLDAGLCSQCTAVEIDATGESVVMERLVYGGAAVQSVRCTTRPAMATVPPRTFDPAPAREGRAGQVRELPRPERSPVRVLERRVRQRETRDLADARVVVAVGRGFAAEEDLGLARELAEVLGGEIGCTRPLSEELHWLPEQACIGLSGVQVKPELYLGVGISGQIQHLTGARGAKVIAAVNQDENAPIFGAADLGIVGDLYQVLPALVREMRKQS